MLKLALRLLLAGLVLLIAVVLFNTFTLHSRQMKVEAVPEKQISDSALIRLMQAVRFGTVSYPGKVDTAAFKGFTAWMDSQFVSLKSVLKLRKVNGFSRLYKWEGKNPNLSPVLLMAHLDVVPVPEEALSKWTHPPFSGLDEGNYIWGRGTLDDKSSALAILEAVKLLLNEGVEPARTVYISLGHDEEVGGKKGAKTVADSLKQAGVKFEFVLDEGLPITVNQVTGVKAPVALIGLSEKGYLTLKLTAHAPGGHSSMPSRDNAVAILSRVVNDLSDNQMPQRIDGPVAQLFDYTSPEMGFGYKMLFANRWLFGGLLKSQLAKMPGGNALTRTTTAPTMVSGGVAENVLPNNATATVNFRILPGETVDDVINHVKKAIGKDSVTIEIGSTVGNPTRVAETDSYGFRVLQTSIGQVYTDALSAPSLVLGATDGRHFDDIARNVYRFFPTYMAPEDLKRVHGIDERISKDDYRKAIRFYYQLLKNL